MMQKRRIMRPSTISAAASLPIVLLLVTGCEPPPADENGKPAAAPGRHTDKSKEFAYSLPAGWTIMSDSRFPHDVILIAGTDGKRRNVVISPQPGPSTLEELKEKYERDLPKALRDFVLVESRLIEVNGRPVLRIIHTNSTPGVPVRQVNYIREVGGKRYFIACTVMQGDGDAYDGRFETFVQSITAADR
ncbi:hypothetical protein JW848_00920 [Candidatus Bipolaricaulota bacterium]|nr:hypothetical protein [Candidatus Bipolaricaulota bacterium]